MPSHRRKNVAHQPTTRSNIPKEKKKLLVLSYLIKLGNDHRANKNQIGTYAQETTQQRGVEPGPAGQASNALMNARRPRGL